MCYETQLLLAPHPYRHVPQIHAPAVIDVYCTAAHRASHICCSLLTLKQQHCLGSLNVCCVCFAFVPLTFDLYCDILFSEHVLTSSLFVSQLQLEVFHAPFVYLVSVNPTTFRDEP